MGVISLILGIIFFIIMILAFFSFLGGIWSIWFEIGAAAGLSVIILGSKASDSPLGIIGMALCGIVWIIACLIGGLTLLLGVLRLLGII